MKSRLGYFEKLGLGATPKNLENIFSDENNVLERLHTFLRNYDVPRNFRKRIWMHVLLEWKFVENVPVLQAQLKQMYDDVRQVVMVSKLALPDPKRKNKRPEDMLCAFRSYLKLTQQAMVFETNEEELHSLMSTFTAVFDEDFLAFFCFRRVLRTVPLTRPHVSQLCQRTSHLMMQRNNHVSHFADEVERHLRLWFRSCFVAVFGPERVLPIFDRWFGMDVSERDHFACAVAVALLEHNVQDDWKDLSRLNVQSSPVEEIKKRADAILEL